MVFAVYLQYPRYVLPGVEGLVAAEHVLDWMGEQVKAGNEVIESRGFRAWVGRKRRKVKALWQVFRGR
jgi:capsule polysaccharide export protein KpsC/LpsZ